MKIFDRELIFYEKDNLREKKVDKTYSF